MAYQQLTLEQRYHIGALEKSGLTQSAIAEAVGVHKSTISRELRRNCGARGYRPQQAHHLARERQQKRACRPRIAPAIWQWVEAGLMQQWSPEQIAGRLRRETVNGETVSHERIYQYIYADKAGGGTLYRHLRCQKQRRKRYGSGRSRRGHIPDRVCISQRPQLVAQRERIGDWEGDTIIGRGHRQALVSLVERRSRSTLLQKVTRKTAAQVSGAMVRQLWPVVDKVHTITLDNGLEFASHTVVGLALSAQTFFAHPYSSWERGTNENTNGLIRQYCPKKSDFTHLNDQDVQEIVEKLNHRPRKCLEYRTPHEVFFEDECCT